MFMYSSAPSDTVNSIEFLWDIYIDKLVSYLHIS